MAAPTIADMFQVGVDILHTTVTSLTKKIVAQTGSVVGKTTDADGVEWWQQVGFASRPAKPAAGSAAAQGIVMRQGGIDACIASQDVRGLTIYGNLADGETCVYAGGSDGNGQARALFKADGSINLYTRKGNTSGGTGMLIQIDASSGAIRLVNDKGYGIVIDGNGVQITSGSAGLTLTGSGNATLVGTGQTQVDGSSICLGSVAVPVVNSVCVGPTGIAARASLKVVCE
jgi:hypothetical protein